jgi:hypothetical protein
MKRSSIETADFYPNSGSNTQLLWDEGDSSMKYKHISTIDVEVSEPLT